MATRALSVYRPPARAAGPSIITIAPPRATRRRGRGGGGFRKKGRRRGGGTSGKNSTKDMVLKVALGGAAFGLIEKLAPTMPTIPIIGKAGTVAIAAYFFGGKKVGLARDICLAASTLAAYQLLRDGKIAGDDAMGFDD